MYMINQMMELSKKQTRTKVINIADCSAGAVYRSFSDASGRAKVVKINKFQACQWIRNSRQQTSLVSVLEKGSFDNVFFFSYSKTMGVPWFLKLICQKNSHIVRYNLVKRGSMYEALAGCPLVVWKEKKWQSWNLDIHLGLKNARRDKKKLDLVGLLSCFCLLKMWGQNCG